MCKMADVVLPQPAVQPIANEKAAPEPLQATIKLYTEEKRHWWAWFSKYDTPAERRLILKLDLLIVFYATTLYWLKNLDQTNLNNAYVSGMSSELGFKGNQLVQFQTMYLVGQSVMQIPFVYLFDKYPMNWVVPMLDIQSWGFFTLAQYKTKSYGEMMAFRFFVGCFEAAFFPGVHYVLGAWYRQDELGRRGGVFYIGNMLGTLTSGLLQASILKSLDGVAGLPAWRWMYIINAAITIPIGILGFFIWPGTPDKCWSFFLSKEEVALAKARLIRVGHRKEGAQRTGFTKADFKRTFSSWRIYVLTIWDVLFFNTGANSSAYLLWLKSIMPKDLVRVNQLSVTAPALGIFYILFINFGADFTRRPTHMVTLANTILFVALLILASGTTNRAARYAAYNLLPFFYAQSSSLYAYSNSILRRDPKERAIVLVTMTCLATASTSFIGLLTYPTVESPRFKKGFIFTATITFLQICFTQVVKWLGDRDDRIYAAQDAARLAELEASQAVSADINTLLQSSDAFASFLANTSTLDLVLLRRRKDATVAALDPSFVGLGSMPVEVLENIRGCLFRRWSEDGAKTKNAFQRKHEAPSVAESLEKVALAKGELKKPRSRCQCKKKKCKKRKEWEEYENALEVLRDPVRWGTREHAWHWDLVDGDGEEGGCEACDDMKRGDVWAGSASAKEKKLRHFLSAYGLSLPSLQIHPSPDSKSAYFIYWLVALPSYTAPYSKSRHPKPRSQLKPIISFVTAPSFQEPTEEERRPHHITIIPRAHFKISEEEKGRFRRLLSDFPGLRAGEVGGTVSLREFDLKSEKEEKDAKVQERKLSKGEKGRRKLERETTPRWTQLHTTVPTW
ncbi:hypothetical protein MNV49_006363 [Pseudohyphozyma bogoriensis]|nr:hypothetical protein MNV49_006363 [Pseudohyphozyma bogoriensis]